MADDLHSLLGTVRSEHIRYYPYVHAVVPNCLPDAYYRRLAACFPGDDVVLDLNRGGRQNVAQNQRNDICAADALRHADAVPQLWRDFVAYHSSPAFFREVVDLLGVHLATTHPGLERGLGKPLPACRAARRFEATADDDFALDCQIGINTPTTEPSSVRRVHTDDPAKVFTALLYLRPDDDDAAGGDLQIYRWKHQGNRLFVGAETDEHDAELVSTVPYAPNTLVFFVNSLHSLHAVSERAVSARSRRLVNVVLQVNRPLPEPLFIKEQKPQVADLASPAPTIRPRCGRIRRLFRRAG